jgi:NAD+ synthase (glutamine-hydrolysing)
VADNLVNARRAFDRAARDRAHWILFPEMFLSGYHGKFDQESVAAGMAEIAGLCRKHAVAALVGTGWKEEGKTFNQVRILDAEGKLAGVYAKKCLCYGEAQWTSPGTTPLVFEVHGVKFGVLICNDLWVTPGFSDGPNPHWSLKQARAGAQVIFHHINSGSDQRYRTYHESNHLVRAAEARCGIVAINAFTPPEVNASSGVVGTGFRHQEALPRDREVIQTIEFRPAVRG